MNRLVFFIYASLCAVTIGCSAQAQHDSAASDEPILRSGKPATVDVPQSQPNVATALHNITPIDWPASVDATKLRGGVRGAIDYLVRTTDDDGRFAYIVNTDSEVPATDEYNVVRHAGTMYGLGMFLERYDDEDGRVKAALVRQGKFLIEQIKPVPGQKDMLAIWSDPAVTGLDGPSQAELGSAGLGLIGLTSLDARRPRFGLRRVARQPGPLYSVHAARRRQLQRALCTRSAGTRRCAAVAVLSRRVGARIDHAL